MKIHHAQASLLPRRLGPAQLQRWRGLSRAWLCYARGVCRAITAHVSLTNGGADLALTWRCRVSCRTLEGMERTRWLPERRRLKLQRGPRRRQPRLCRQAGSVLAAGLHCI